MFDAFKTISLSFNDEPNKLSTNISSFDYFFFSSRSFVIAVDDMITATAFALFIIYMSSSLSSERAGDDAIFYLFLFGKLSTAIIEPSLFDVGCLFIIH